VWDGLRPDSVNAQNTPNLARLRDQLGVNFTDNHAVFPTFTMMNAAAFATGSYPGTHGFYGNTEYQPGPAGPSASGVAADFTQPIFTEDYGILRALDGYYTTQANSALFLVDTLFQAAHRKGLKTAAVGKSGPAFIQDHREDGALGVILDENIAFPATFAQALQASGYALPAYAVHYPFATGTSITLAGTNGDPTATVGANIVNLADARTSDPRATRGSPHNAKNEYMMGIFTGYILPELHPDLSLVWFRNPDSTEHTFGPGSAAYVDALRDQDALLGQLQAELAALGLTDKTDIIVVSDHGHSTVAGDPELFPLRALTGAADGSGDIGTVDAHGYSVSGDLRSADLLSRAGLVHVYDGVGCTYDPVLSGIRSDGSRVYPTLVDTDGSVCGATGTKYSTASFKVPATVPTDAVIIAANGGSDYFYVPSHDPTLVKRVVTALEQRRGYGAIFVRSAYGPVPGALALSDIKVEGSTRGSPPTPDIIVSFDWNEAAVTAGNLGVPGTEYESAQNNRGMHGSFSPIDVHNTLIAAGPDFKARYVDAYPSGNVDVPVTVARVLGLALPGTDGRVLSEALAGAVVTYGVATETASGGLVPLAQTCNPDDILCGTPVLGLSYSFTLTKKVLTLDDGTTKVTYFDKAKATRQ
jgi:arylsulfatase A-like enzyme